MYCIFFVIAVIFFCGRKKKYVRSQASGEVFDLDRPSKHVDFIEFPVRFKA